MTAFRTAKFFAAAFAIGLVSVSAASAATAHGTAPRSGGAPQRMDPAVEACLVQPNSYGPVELVGSVGDGVGDTLVWLSDRDGDLWACNGDMNGAVFAYTLVGPDLLDGQGVAMVQEVGTAGSDPLAGAARLCAMVGGEGAEVVAYVDDGFGDVLAWVRTGDGGTYMCNASPAGALYAFEAVGAPLNAGGDAAGLGAALGLEGGELFPWQV